MPLYLTLARDDGAAFGAMSPAEAQAVRAALALPLTNPERRFLEQRLSEVTA
jgi:hypothetical protein